MSLRVVHSLLEDVWREYVSGHPHGNVFHTPELAEVFGRAIDFEPELWAAVEDNRILALMLPVRVHLSKRYVLRRLTSRTIVYGSVLANRGPAGSEALSKLLDEYSQEVRGKSMFTELRNIADLRSFQPVLQQHRFAYEDHLNYIVDLARPLDALFGGIGPRTRKNIRHATNSGHVRVELVTEKQGLAACYEILRNSYQNARVPLAGWALFEAAFDVLYPKNMIRFTLAKVDGMPMATSADLLYKDTIFGWYGGIDRSRPSHAASELLTWDVLKWGAENGYRTYDFGGAGRPKEKYGVRDFKAKFGGRLVCYGRNIRVHSPQLLRLSKAGYRASRNWLFGRKSRAVRGTVVLEGSSKRQGF